MNKSLKTVGGIAGIVGAIVIGCNVAEQKVENTLIVEIRDGAKIAYLKSAPELKVNINKICPKPFQTTYDALNEIKESETKKELAKGLDARFGKPIANTCYEGPNGLYKE